MTGADVALVGPFPSAGGPVRSGVESYIASLSAALTEAGAKVTVLAPQEPAEPARARHGSVEVWRCFRRGPMALPSVARVAQATGAAVVHLQHEVFLYGGPASVPGLPWALDRLRRLGVGPVVTLHQVVDPAGVDRAFTRLHRVRVPAGVARLALQGVQGTVRHLADATIVHEHGFAEILPEARVIPLGLATAAPAGQADARRRLDLPESDRLTVLCFGFLSPYKGLEAALAAAELTADAVELVVAGGPHPRLAGRDDYAQELGRRWGHVARFTGFVDEVDVSAWLSAADVVLLPYPRPFSSSGPLGLALGHARPVLLSTAMARCTGAPAELAVSCEPTELATRLRQLARDARARERLAAASATFAQGRSWSSVAERHIELYEEVRHGARRRHHDLRPS